MSTRPVNLDDGSKLIFSVVRNVADRRRRQLQQGGAVAALRSTATLPKSSTIKTAGAASFGARRNMPRPTRTATPSLRVTNLPITLSLGGTLYVTELYTTHPTITPLAGLRREVPETLYSIAYF